MVDEDFDSVATELSPSREDHFLDVLGERSAILRDGLAFWISLPSEGATPQRSSFDPFDVPNLMPNMILFEVQDCPRDFRYRVIGTCVSEHFTKNWTGCWMSEIDHQIPPSRVWDTCNRVATNHYPILGKVPYVGPNSEFIFSEDLIVPLANE